MARARSGWVFALALAGAWAPASGQQALVLSTGASRGIAHAGAVVGLDSLGYDPDLVVGSSMGAVVGALYAAGFPPAEVWRLVQAADWGDAFKPLPLMLGPSRSVHFPMVQLGANLADFELTRGFIPDWRVNRLLTRLLFEGGARGRSDFERLHRRYRAVVADVSTGEELVLAEGDLARAVRASMGTPGFFAPVEWDGLLISDGGIANYLPISVARRMGASTIVAVDVSRPHPRVTRKDPAALGGRAIGLLMRNAIEDTLPDVLVTPDIDPDFPGAVFPADATDLLRLGLAAALEAPPATGPRKRIRPLRPLPQRFAGLRLEVPDPALERMVRSAFSDVAPGPWDLEKLMRAVDRLYSTGLVNGVWPRVEAEASLLAEPSPQNGGAEDALGANPGRGEGRHRPDGATRQESRDVLVVRVDPHPRLSLAGALGYDNDRGGRIWGEIQQRLPSTLPIEVTVGAAMDGLERWGEGSLRLHGLGRPLTWTLGGHYRETANRVSGPDGGGELEVRRAGGWLASELRHIYPDWLGALGGHAEWIDLEDGEEGLSWGPFLRFSSAGAPALVVGTPTEVEAELRFGEIDYWTASFRGSGSLPLGRFLSAAVVDLAVADRASPLDVMPTLGDRHAMPGLAWHEERGRARLLGGFDLAREFLMGGYLRLRLRGGSATEVFDDLGETASWVGGAALEGLWTTPFGPIVAGVGASTRRTLRFDVNLGQVF